mmetsp:Transcript_124450/g.398046  ORF Transcript_124450/g.398046 Transcript_124450/m.398046 type:complete len:243 (-) Transcript_124450:1601-2329(-)
MRKSPTESPQRTGMKYTHASWPTIAFLSPATTIRNKREPRRSTEPSSLAIGDTVIHSANTDMSRTKKTSCALDMFSYTWQCSIANAVKQVAGSSGAGKNLTSMLSALPVSASKLWSATKPGLCSPASAKASAFSKSAGRTSTNRRLESKGWSCVAACMTLKTVAMPLPTATGTSTSSRSGRNTSSAATGGGVASSSPSSPSSLSASSFSASPCEFSKRKPAGGGNCLSSAYNLAPFTTSAPS